MTELAIPGAGLLAQADRELPGRALPWLEQLRREGRALFQERGIPTTADEDWRFTDLRELARADFSSAPGSHATATPGLPELGPEAHRLVFCAGELQSIDPGSLPAGVRISSLAQTLEEEPERLASRLGTCAEQKSRSFTALNTALFRDGAVVELEAGRHLESPVHLVFVEPEGAEPVAVHPRNLIIAGDGSRLTLVEHYIGSGPGGGLTNAVSEILCGRHARVEHVVLQEQARGSFHIAQLAIRQQEGSEFRQHSVALGARLSRVDIECILGEEGARAELLGIYLARDRQHVDHHTTIDHATPHTTSRELYKGILDDRGRGVFHGRIHVRPDAQKADASQTNRTLLLSDRAQINTKPQLEIYADDVLCSHGASVGQLNPDQLFYLRTRGIDRDAARAMLTLAFASEVLSELPLEPLRALLEQRMAQWLSEETP